MTRPKDADASWRAQAGRIGSLTRWAHESDRREATNPARSAFWRSFEARIREEHPDWSDAQIEAGADALRRAHFHALALKSAKARARRRAYRS